VFGEHDVAAGPNRGVGRDNPNHLKGIVDEVEVGDVLAHVTMRVGDSIIESVITGRSAEELGLKKEIL
jgi:molybdopterin-binding protein